MKQYKLLEINSCYDLFLNKLYEKFTPESSYEELMELYFNACYCESNYIERYFESELNIESKLIIYNNEFAQNRWDDNPDKDAFHILLRQLKSYNPDVLYITDINLFDCEKLKVIKQTGKKGMKLVCYHFSFLNRSLHNVLHFYDLCFTGSLKFCKDISRYCKNVKIVRHAFETTILEKLQKENFYNKAAFVGSIFIGNTFHTNRIDALCQLKEANVPFDFYGNIYNSFNSRKQRVLNLLTPHSLIQKRKNIEKYLRDIKKTSMFGLDYYKIISSYSVNINVHAPINGTGCGNQRMFEVTGIGSCLVTDYREENNLLFDADNEIVVYHNNDELVEKVKYLIDNPEECKRIAKNGQHRTLNNYTYKHKALQINEYIQELFI